MANPKWWLGLAGSSSRICSQNFDGFVVRADGVALGQISPYKCVEKLLERNEPPPARIAGHLHLSRSDLNPTTIAGTSVTNARYSLVRPADNRPSLF